MPFFDAHIDYAMPALDPRDAPNASQVRPEILRAQRGALLSIWARWPELQGDPARAWAVIDTAIAHHRALGPIATTADDLGDAPVFLHHLEGADLLGWTDCVDDVLSGLQRLYDLGVRGITPVYSQGNAFGGGSNQHDGPGLSALGAELLDAMHALGMLIDTAHMNLHTRADVLAWAQTNDAAVAYTHGALVGTVRFADARKHERGITLEQAEQIRARGGVVGICPTRPFVASTQEFDATIDLLLQSPLGSRGIAIGSDFGGVGPDELLPGLGDHAGLDRHLRGRVERVEISEGTYLDVAHRNVETLVTRILR